jgi:two-component system, response regulator PdtaR
LTNRIEPCGLWYAVLIYWFSIHNADNTDRETTGRMALADDNAARAFGKAMIRDMIRGDSKYAGWTMDIAQRARTVCSLPFSRNESRSRRLDSVSAGVVMGSFATKRAVVLIVEDEFLLRMHAAEMIGDSGFDVVEAGNADEAIAILEARTDIHVVFTDIQMPGSMDGLKLAKFVRGRWPPIKIVATSGFVNVGKDDLPEGGRFLSKPYRPEQIVATLREVTAAA